ncbi:MAG: C4-type zinc ribbon domain-containing protein [Polyangiaceae bacterium]|nr:C4-type zinc ribbon domain-containing protein [Polyangiaceae bacterium]
MSTTEQVSEQIRALEELALMDAEVKTLEEKLSEERGVLSALKDSLKKLDDKLQIDRAALSAADKQRSELQVEVRTMTNQIDHSREKLNRARTERESNAAQRELEELRKLIRDREHESVRIDTDMAPVRAAVEAADAERKRTSLELSTKEGAIQEKVARLEVDYREKGGGRDAIIKRLPPALFRKYEMIRQRRGSAVAQTTDGTCNRCNMSLPPQLYHRLRREPLIEQCPSCHRMIYFAATQTVQKVD